MLENRDNQPNPIAFAVARINENNPAKTNINDVIAALTVYHEKSSRCGETEEAREYNGKIQVYSYLRDQFFAGKNDPPTLGQVLSVIERGTKIAVHIVRFWVHEGYLKGHLELEAVSRGYPELKEQAEEVALRSMPKGLSDLE